MTYKDKHIAQDAARNPFSHIEPQIAKVYHFCMIHYGNLSAYAGSLSASGDGAVPSLHAL